MRVSLAQQIRDDVRMRGRDVATLPGIVSEIEQQRRIAFAS